MRNLRPETKLALVERARANGHSLQAELHEILQRAALEPIAVPAKKTLHLVVGGSQGRSTWPREEIYEVDL